MKNKLLIMFNEEIKKMKFSKKSLLTLVSLILFNTSPTKAGEFDGMWEGDANNHDIVLSIVQKGTDISGTFDEPSSPAVRISGNISGRKITFKRLDSNNQVYTGYMSSKGNSISGTFSHREDCCWPWSVSRR